MDASPVLSTDDLELYSGFAQECGEKLEDLEGLILRLEAEPDDQEVPKEMYRILHTIKGTAASLQLKTLAHYVHKFEDLVSPFRSNENRVSSRDTSQMLTATELLKRGMADLKRGRIPSFPETLAAPAVTHSAAGDTSRMISVELSVIDDLLSHVGNITIIKDLISHGLRSEDGEKSSDLLSELTKESDHLQRKLGQLRKSRISAALRAAQRVIRDLGVDLKKKALFRAMGTNVLVDFDVSKVLADVFVHLARNSMDHGIETAEVRASSGKPIEATIEFSISANSEETRIEIRDDGRGIDVEKIKQKALEKGLLRSEALPSMGQTAILNLIFESGFSTAEAVTEVSGRGVGLDMVRKSVTDLNGTLSVSSEIGKGTCFSIVIPERKSTNIVTAFVAEAQGVKMSVPRDQVATVITLGKLREQNLWMQSSEKCYVYFDKAHVCVFDPVTGKDRIPSGLSDDLIVIVLQEAGQARAVAVENMLGLDKVVVKDMEVLRESFYDRMALTGKYGLILYFDLTNLERHV
jgi:two-component system, chemotaxis family, sensor kinase CheA